MRDRRDRPLALSRSVDTRSSRCSIRPASRGPGAKCRCEAPLTDEQVRALKVGDVVLVSGRMFTGRDAVHSHLMKHEPPVDLRGSVLYHCGPVVVKEGDTWRVTAAGPTTSIREEPYQGEIIKRYGVRAVIGKGGMGAKTLAALKEHGAVYLNAIGGAAQFYARTINGVDGVSLLEFGTPEAMWHLTRRRTSRRSSRWTRTATACTRTSSRSPASTWRRLACSSAGSAPSRELLERRPAIALAPSPPCRGPSFRDRRSRAAETARAPSRRPSSGSCRSCRRPRRGDPGDRAAGAAVTNVSPPRRSTRTRTSFSSHAERAERAAQHAVRLARLRRAPATSRTPGSSRGSSSPVRPTARSRPAAGVRQNAVAARARTG